MITEQKLEKTQIKIAWITNEHGKKEPEILLAGTDFFESDQSIIKKIVEFKKTYLELINAAKKHRKAGKGKKSGKISQPSSKKIWSMSNLLSEFRMQISNRFEIINEADAYSRDLNLSKRSMREFLHFGKNFHENEVYDEVPYSTYLELCSKLNTLQRKGIFEEEKRWLSERAKNGDVPKRDDYRKRLKGIANE